MTPKLIADFMTSLLEVPQESHILEPSSGKGIFIDSLRKKGFKNIDAYEIDETIVSDEFVKIESFVSAKIDKKYNAVIGNPPYIRWKNLEDELKLELAHNDLWNLYLDKLNDYSSIFILKSIENLSEGGELVFITPEYWLNTTQSKNLRKFIINNGYLTDIFLFKETPIFDKVSASLIVFKYVKDKNKKNRPKINISKYDKTEKLDEYKLDLMKKGISNSEIESFKIPQFNDYDEWLIAHDSDVESIKDYEKYCKKLLSNELYRFEEFCEIGNGMVSGLDKAFQYNSVNINEDESSSLIKVIKAKDLEVYKYKKTTQYIFLNNVQNEKTLIDEYPNFYMHLLEHKEKLLNRYNYSRDIKYWEWVFLRNYNLFKTNTKKIFIPCKERISHKNYFRFALIEPGIYPTQDVTAIIPKENTKESIEYITALLNSRYVFNWLRFKGIIKGNIVEFSRKPISRIPYRKIDFDNPFEVELHDKITNKVKELKNQKDLKAVKEINKLIDNLMK